jgi:hypothetical protein
MCREHIWAISYEDDLKIEGGFNSPSPLPLASAPLSSFCLELRGGIRKGEGGVPPTKGETIYSVNNRGIEEMPLLLYGIGYGAAREDRSETLSRGRTAGF